ncbi:MAG: sodium dependent phosphate transporter [Planctomycetota bacterium]
MFPEPDLLHQPAALPAGGPARRIPLRLFLLLVLLFLFLVAIDLMSGAFKGLGRGTAEALFTGIANPFAGLAVGVLATVLVQSSSVTTSTIVALVGSGQLEVAHAVPMVMGANIGTTITNTLVSLGSIRRGAEFRRAFAAATVHDFFNLLTVAILLPAEILTGFLHKAAAWFAGILPIRSDAQGFHSPIKTAVKYVAGGIEDLIGGPLGLHGALGSIALLVLAVALIFLALLLITKNMRIVIAARAEKALNAALEKSGLIGILIGVALTVAVQSSSITTSLLVPLCGAGVLTLANAFPVMLGANIGTTVTALIASMATDVNGLTISTCAAWRSSTRSPSCAGFPSGSPRDWLRGPPGAPSGWSCTWPASSS